MLILDGFKFNLVNTSFMNRFYGCFFLLLFFASTTVSAQYPAINQLLFGVAYYDEYMPYEQVG